MNIGVAKPQARSGTLLFRDAEERSVGADEESAVGDGEAASDHFPEVIVIKLNFGSAAKT